MLGTAFGLRQPDGDSTTSVPPALSCREPLRQRAADVEQRQAEQQRARRAASAASAPCPRPGRPGCRACAAPACGMPVVPPVWKYAAMSSGRDPAAADQAIGGLRIGQRVEVMRRRSPRRPRRATTTDRLQVRQLAADAFDLLPDVEALQRAERDQHLGPRGAQDVGDLPGLEAGVDRVRDAGRLAPYSAQKLCGTSGSSRLTTSPAPTPSACRRWPPASRGRRTRCETSSGVSAGSALGRNSSAGASGRGRRRAAAPRRCSSRRCARRTASPRTRDVGGGSQRGQGIADHGVERMRSRHVLPGPGLWTMLQAAADDPPRSHRRP